MDEFSAKKLIKDVDHIKRTLTNIDKTLALNTQSLEVHIKRSDLLEAKLAPVEAHVEQVRGVGKFIMYASLLATIAAGIYAVLQYFKV
jgi:hypothetical protein